MPCSQTALWKSIQILHWLVLDGANSLENNPAYEVIKSKRGQMKKILLLLPLILVAACGSSNRADINTARAQGACEEWANQAPDWNEFNTGYIDIPGSRGWSKTHRRICGWDYQTGKIVVGREFTQKFINAPCHHGDDCPTDLKDAFVEVKRWNPAEQ